MRTRAQSEGTALKSAGDGLALPSGVKPAWHARGLCLDLPVRFFFPRVYDSAEPAKRVCAECPVRLECLEHALTANENYGVWGGTDERERKRLRRAARQRPALAEAG